MRIPVTLIILLLILISFAQEPVYFNNLYQHENNFAIGMTILQTEGGYIGYGGTESPNNIGQMLLFYKISPSGNELIWKPFGEDYHDYFYGNVGGAMIKTSDGNFALACHYGYNDLAYASLIKLNANLDTIWKNDYNFQTYTIGINCTESSDKGFLVTGWVWESGPNLDVLLLKTDSLGNYQWHQIYGGDLVEQGENVIETQDGGYLIGGFIYDPAVYHTLDAMVIKTDSLGNEEWTKYYGNPDVDDGMALVAMADDGNYLVATVYGVNIMSNMYREGRIWIIKIDNNGNIIEENKYGPSTISNQIKNIRKLENGYYISSGFKFSYDDEYFKGWMFKFSENLDSAWMRDYHHYDGFEETNFFYDACPTSDNGYIAIGKARPDGGGQTNKMWIVKVDSMGCDTPGCFTTVISEELFVNSSGELRVWPNPTTGKFEVRCSKFEVGGTKMIMVYNSQGVKVEEVEVTDNTETLSVDVSRYQNGLYYLQYIHSNQIMETVKFIKN